MNAILRGVNFSGAILNDIDFAWADLTDACLSGASLNRANLYEARLSGADLSDASMWRWHLEGADLSRANLHKARLAGVSLSGANLSGACLVQAVLVTASLWQSNLSGADLSGADLTAASLSWADLSGARLSGAILEHAALVKTNLEGADLTGCRVYGISAWDLNLERAKQENLIATPPNEPEITVDDLEVAQFIYLLVRSEKISRVIDTITSKVVLILGRFTPERKAVLDTLRNELRRCNYLPVLFDFNKPASMDLTGTVSILARLARFIVADLTDPSSVPYELATVIPSTVVPVQPVLLEGGSEFAMFADLRARYHWVLATYVYASTDQLIANLRERVIVPAEAKSLELRGR